MSVTNGFEPKIVAYVCNWCTYLGADLAGTTRLEYPPNVRIVRLPCTGRLDFNLIVKGFEVGADAVIVSGCHPGDCHYTAGNYHARRRWILFRELLDTLGFDLRRIHFAWISAAEGKKFQEVVTEVTEQTRAMGPYNELYQRGPVPALPAVASLPSGSKAFDSEPEMREYCRALLAEGTVKAVIGYGARGPVIVTRSEDAERLVWNSRCYGNLAAYLKRKEVKALGAAAIVVKSCDEKSLMVLENETQIDRKNIHVIGMQCEGMGLPKCSGCKTRSPRFADRIIGKTTAAVAPENPPANRFAALMERTPQERMAFWANQFEHCTRCYACRQVCPLCYCERCIVDKNRPITIDPAPSVKGNFAWQIARAFHLAARCVGCGECSRACPAHIDLGLLNIALQRAAAVNFGYEPGVDPLAEPAVGSYSLQDKEEFIR